MAEIAYLGPVVQREDVIHGSYCAVCKEQIRTEDKDRHIIKCLQKFSYGLQQHSPTENSPTSLQDIVSCPVCHKNLSRLHYLRRSQHINRCFDNQDIKMQGKEPFTSDVATHLNALKNCPICGKSTAGKTRLAHIKSCCSRKKVQAPQLLQAIQLQANFVAQRQALGLPTLSPRKLDKKKLVKEPKNQEDADLHIALALSASLKEEDERKREEFVTLHNGAFFKPEAQEPTWKNGKEMDAFEQMHLSNLGRNGGVLFKPSKKSKKKLRGNGILSALILTTDDDRKLKVQDKVSALLSSEKPINNLLSWELMCYHLTETAMEFCQSANKGVFESRILSLASEPPVLWKAASQQAEQVEYYVDSLTNFITPSKVAAGSKLRSLSQIPGRRIAHHLDFYGGASNSSFLNGKKEHHLTPKSQGDGHISASKTHRPCLGTDAVVDVTSAGSEAREVNSKRDWLSQRSNKNLDSSEENFQSTQERVVARNGFLTQIARSVEVEGPQDDSRARLSGARKLAADLEGLVGNEEFSDMSIKVQGGRLIPVHQLILCLRCPRLFNTLHDNEKLEAVIKWNDVPYKAAMSFLRYLYTGHYRSAEQHRADVLLLAERYNVQDLCEEVVSKEYNEMALIQEEMVTSKQKAEEDWAMVLQQAWGEKENAVCDELSDAEVNRTSVERGHKSPSNFKSELSSPDTRKQRSTPSSDPPPGSNAGSSSCVSSASDHSGGSAATSGKDYIESPIRGSQGWNVHVSPMSADLLSSPELFPLHDSSEDENLCDSSPQKNRLGSTPLAASSPRVSDSSYIRDASNAVPVPSEPLYREDKTRDAGNNKEATTYTAESQERIAAIKDRDYKKTSPRTSPLSAMCPVKSLETAALLYSSPSRVSADGVKPDVESTTKRRKKRNRSSSPEVELEIIRKIHRVESDYRGVPTRYSSPRFKGFVSQDAPPHNRKSQDSDVDRSPLASSAPAATDAQRRISEELGRWFEPDLPSYWTESIAVDPVPVPAADRTKAAAPHPPRISPITPLPDYHAMITPELRQQLRKYGLKHFPRTKAVNLLNYIYDQTHPGAPKPTEQNTDVLPVYYTSESQQTGGLPSQKQQSHMTASSSSRSECSGPENDVGKPSEHRQGAPTQCKVDKHDQAAANKALSSYLSSNRELYDKVLMYQPLDLGELQKEIQEAGLKIATKNLTEFLDKQCITYSVPRSKLALEKQQKRSKRFKQRVAAAIARQSQ